MWLVSRIKDYGYEGEDTNPLFVTANEQYAKDWIESAKIERDAAMTIKKPVFYPRLANLPMRSGKRYDQKEYNIDLAAWEQKMRDVLQLDQTLDPSEFDSLDTIDYEIVEVELRE